MASTFNLITCQQVAASRRLKQTTPTPPLPGAPIARRGSGGDTEHDVCETLRSLEGGDSRGEIRRITITDANEIRASDGAWSWPLFKPVDASRRHYCVIGLCSGGRGNYRLLLSTGETPIACR